MPFVVDASVAASWLMPDEHDLRAETAYRSLQQDWALAPSLWWFEVRNLLITNERRARITQDEANKMIALLSGLPIQIDREPEEIVLLKLARRHRLTVYDASYLELALRLRFPIASLDKDLAKAARNEGVMLVGE